jgi:adenylate cyclase
MLSPKTKRNILRIVPFGVIWLVFSIIYTLLEKGLLGDLDHYPSTGNPYNFTRNIFVTPIAALITGFVIGTLEISISINGLLKKVSPRKFYYKSAIYLALILVFTIILSLADNFVELRTSIFNRQVWETSRLLSCIILFECRFIHGCSDSRFAVL